MADINGSDADKRRAQIEAAAENAALKLVARWMMAVVVPFLGAVAITGGGWFAGKLITGLEENTRATSDLRNDFNALIKHQLPGLASSLNTRIDVETGSLRNRIDAHVQRLDTIDRRFEFQDRRDQGQDGKLEEMQRRLWRLPEIPAPPAERPSIVPYPR